MIWQVDTGDDKIEGVDALGRPMPEYAASLGLIAAPRFRRSAAAVIDWLFGAVLWIPAAVALSPLFTVTLRTTDDVAALLQRPDLLWIVVGTAVSYGLSLAYFLVQTILLGRRGVTLGKAVCGLRSINVKTLARPGFWRGAMLRYLTQWVSFVLPLLGPLLVVAVSPLFDRERRGRGWPDLAAATWYVDVRRGLNPYDVKRMRIARKRVKTPEYEARSALPSLATPQRAAHSAAAYQPSQRFSGGVLGAHLSAPSAAAEAAAARSVVSPAAAPMIAAVPGGRPADGTNSDPGASVPRIPTVAADRPPVVAEQHKPDPVGGGPAQASLPTAVVTLDDGQRVELRSILLLGRDPVASVDDGSVQLLPIVDSTRSVSKTHLALYRSATGVGVTDRNSTNGTFVQRGGAELSVAGGIRVDLQVGDRVRFGDRTLHVEWT